jgi:hypothetical protein
MIRTTGFTPTGDRYIFDFRYCTPAKGWAQLDTRQDASYYGNWINPITLEFVSHCEGDQTHIKCESEQEFVAYVRETIAWHKERGYFIGIDGMCNPGIIAAFTVLNLDEFLH